jgi:hypothetical protein
MREELTGTGALSHGRGSEGGLVASAREVPFYGAVTAVEDAQARRDLDSLRRLLAADDWPPDYLD